MRLILKKRETVMYTGLNRNLISLRLMAFAFSVLLVISNLHAQDRKYERKSVTSLGAVLFKGEHDDELVRIINNRLDYFIKISRFDYNQLSQSAVEGFVQKANQTDLSPSNIASALDETLVPKITQVVSAVAEERAKGNLKEEDIARAAVDKMKGSGLTGDDILKVMNSAYLYLPVVTSFEQKGANATIKGYILWYRIAVGGQDKASAVWLKGVSTIQEGTASANEKDSYQLKKRSVSGDEYARIMAVNTWARNLAVEMKKIPDFQLSAEVLSVDGSYADAALGAKEGIVLDDGYDVVEQQEDDSGKISSHKIGFYRVWEVQDNRADANSVSRLRRFIGSDIERGTILLEHPQLGIDITLRPKFFFMTLPRYAAPAIGYSSFALIVASKTGVMPESYDAFYGGHGFIFSSDVKSGFGVDMNFNYNLAKLLRSRQLFLNLDLSMGFPVATVDELALSGLSVSPFVGSAYLGIMKKFWAGRANFNFEAAGGVDYLDLTYTSSAVSGYPENMKFYAPGVKVDLGLEYLLNPDWSFSLNAGYKFGISPIGATVKFKGYDKEFDITDQISSNPFFGGVKDLSFTGASFSIGLSYALPSLSVDPFAFLSAKDIDY